MSEPAVVSAAGDLSGLLKQRFGHDAFRPMQEAIVADAMAGRDVFVLLPTGGGKSLCYQLPAVAQPGRLTIVVSPLIALMHNQVDLLTQHGVAATLLNSTVAPDEARQREADIADGKYDLAYLAPERLMSGAGRALLARLPEGLVGRIAIDEAHCISEWGHDFRPDYRMLGGLRDQHDGKFRDVPIMALTATATPQVAEDIVAQLNLRDPAVHRGGFERDNLYYEVRPKQRVADQVLAYCRDHPEDDGIVYRQSRRGCEELADMLRSAGVAAVPYHAGLDPAEREANQHAFIYGEARVVVATIAFGMGVDKPDVRFVIHADLPRHLEGYYQETGRAGRDGLAADCLLFYSGGDRGRIEHFIALKEDPQQQELARKQLAEVIRFAHETGCRMPPLLGYFGQDHPGDCGHCDNCRNPPKLVDATDDARRLLSAVARTGQRFGLSHVIDVLRGSHSERVTSRDHQSLSVHGIGQHQATGYWRQLAEHLVQHELLGVTKDQYRTTHLTPGSKPLLKGDTAVQMPVSRAMGTPGSQGSRTSRADPIKDYDRELFQKLRELRRAFATEQQVPPYVVFGDVTLRQLARDQPTDNQAMLRVSGVGQTKLERYGEAFMEVIREHQSAEDGG
jgi:ATP-dependent DNA helicase RecQ